MKPSVRRASLWAAALLATLAVFTMYLQPDMIVMLANQVWACF